uniref:Uncharacterized protein n=1 Tax=Latimeria chalumnae TaxID=7897 RepID=H3B3Q3_LATCH
RTVINIKISGLNTGLTDDLLEVLATAIMKSQSEVELVNLNLNNVGPQGAQILTEVLKAKFSIKGLLLYGNKLGDEGVGIILKGLMELLLDPDCIKTELQDQSLHMDKQQGPNQKKLNLFELDIGNNQLTNEGMKNVVAFLHLNPPLQYLGLSRSNAIDINGWKSFFNSLKTTTHISHLLLDENDLGNEGAKLLAEILKVNQSICKIDLDWNGIGDEGANALIESLKSRGNPLGQLNLDGNQVGGGG